MLAPVKLRAAGFYGSLIKSAFVRDVNKDLTPKDQGKDKDLTPKDQDKGKDLTPKDQDKDKDLLDLTPKDNDNDKDKDLKYVLKESLRTRRGQGPRLDK